MPTTSKSKDDIIHLASTMLGNILGARHDLRGHAEDKFGALAKFLGLPTREEFETMRAMIVKARQAQEAMEKRIKALEGKTKRKAK